MGKRYCFFNVDGLLNRTKDWKKPFTIDYGLVHLFCFFLAKNDLVPVMTSSWRVGFIGTGDVANAPYIKEIEKIFADYGLKIYDKTPVLKGRPREKEIERFLYFHKNRNYIVIDGDPDEYTKANEHVYFIDPKMGFAKDDVKKVEKMMKRIDKKSA